jgi:GWxTD domain-containing protein
MIDRVLVFILRLALISTWFFAGEPAAFGGWRTAAAQAKEPLSEASKQWLEEVVPYIITPREKDVFVNLPTELDRGQFIETFWKKRDPNPRTPENEFKLEYYRRIALANKFFGTGGVPGWRTDRGRLYILLGPPKEIERDLTYSGSVLTISQGPKETWQYWGLPNPNLPYNLEFTFVDKFGTGNYVLEQTLKMDQGRNEAFDPSDLTFQFDYLETISEAMKNPFENLEKLKGVITTQVTYNLIPFQYGAFSFKGTEKKSLMPLLVAIPYASLPSKRSGYDYFFSLNLTVNVSNPLGQVVFEASKDLNFKKTATELERLLNTSFRFQTSFSLEPGDYRLHLLVLDNYSGKVGTSHQPVSVPDLSADGPAMSDIILSTEGVQTEGPAEGEKEGLAAAVLRANTERVFRAGDEMSVFFEVYNLSLNEATGRNKLRAEYDFIQAGTPLVRIPAPPIEPSVQKDCRVQTSFRLKNFQPGEYVLRAAVSDENSGQSVSREVPFSISAARPPKSRP